jgi:hypothetical protein
LESNRALVTFDELFDALHDMGKLADYLSTLAPLADDKEAL